MGACDFAPAFSDLRSPAVITPTVYTLDQVKASYTRFFIQEFASMLAHNVKDVCPGDEALVSQTITSTIDAFYNEQTVGVESFSAAAHSKFIHECAEYALSKGYEDPTSLEAYNEISALPSIYIEDIDQSLTQLAATLPAVLNTVVIDTIAKDAHETVALIAAKVKNKIEQYETGGAIHRFNWGLLSDGLWLNGALMKAGEIAHLFDPSVPTKKSFAVESFDAARRFIRVPENRMEHEGEFSLMVENCEDATKAFLGENLEHSIFIKRLLIEPGFLNSQIFRWKEGLIEPTSIVQNVGELSQAIGTLSALRQTRSLLAEDLISETIVNRVDEVYDAITLCLVAHHALRETQYKDTLIMSVESVPDAPMVDVFVNEDNVSRFEQEGGDETDLLPIGMYLDPKRGNSNVDGGRSVDWVCEKKEDILAKMIVEEEERAAKIMRGEMTLVENTVKESVFETVSQYTMSAGLESIRPEIHNQITDLATKVSGRHSKVDIALEAEVASILAGASDLDIIKDSMASFIKFSASEDEATKSSAKCLTVVEMAVTKTLKTIHDIA